MYKIKINTLHNTIFITLGDVFNIQEAKEILERITEITPKLKKGFKLLTDLSSLKEIETGAQHFIEETMTLLNRQGIAKIIRIIPDPAKDIGFNIMSLFHYSKDVKINTYKSFKELVEDILY